MKASVGGRCSGSFQAPMEDGLGGSLGRCAECGLLFPLVRSRTGSGRVVDVVRLHREPVTFAGGCRMEGAMAAAALRDDPSLQVISS
jgi:hypothetical protein